MSYQEKIENITTNLKHFVEKEQGRDSKIGKLEEKMQNIERYLAKSDDYENHSKIIENNMDGFLRKGIMDGVEFKSLSSDDAEAGVIITPTLNKKILSFMHHKSPMRNLASIETISTSAVDYIIEEGDFAAGWVGETEERKETKTAQLVRKRINVHEMYAQPKATQKLLDDAEINVETWLAERIADSFVKTESDAFIQGDGNRKPMGLLKCDKIKAMNAGGEVTVDMLMALLNELPEQYVANATFIMNRMTLSRIQALKDKMDRFVWQQSLTDPLKQTILGIPVVCVSEMPNVESNKLAIALGDFKNAYKVIDRSNISIMRDPYTEKPFVKFYAVKRVGGDVINPDAVRFAKFA